MKKIDLHIHTTASDGVFTPQEVIYWAHKKKLKTIAITDHDTIAGIDDAIIEAKKYDIEVIPGIEINTTYKDLEIHILGYYIDYKKPYLHKTLQEIRNARYNRAKNIVSKLGELGFSITMDEVVKLAGTASIGRPHIARVLENHKYVQNTKEAFEKYIGKDGAAFIERYKISPFEAIQIIIDCGGIPVLAHPGLIKDLSIIKELVDSGLQGLEAFHSKHNEYMSSLYISIAKQYDLIITGGSDCHGTIYNGQPILGSLPIDKKYLDQLKAKQINNLE